MIAHIHPVTGQNQSVKEHCIETAIISEKFGLRMNLNNSAYLAGMIHDLGKMTGLFKEYIEKAAADKNSIRKGEVNHSSAGGLLIYERYYKGDDAHRLTAQLLMNAIFAHHGLFDVMSPEGKDIVGSKLLKKDQIGYEEAISNYFPSIITYDELDGRFEKAVVEIEHITCIIKNLVKDYIEGNQKYVAKDFYLSCLQRLLLSQLIDADRLNTARFCGDREPNDIKDENVNKELWEELYYRLEQTLQNFTQNDKISQYRKSISEDCFAFSQNTKGIYQLMVPTGGGKTLASLRFALSHARHKNIEHIYYVAPYMSILDQNADVIKNILRREDVILEHHSNVINESEEDSEAWRHLTENWDCPIVLTTMVQMLNTLFDGRTQCIRRMHNLANSIIIFDEIQSIPVKCIHVFNLAVNFLTYVCGATVILCSATQPSLDKNVEYKILLGTPSGMIQNINELYKKFRRVEIKDKTVPSGYDAEQISNMIVEMLKKSNNVLVVMNTKKAALKLYATVKEQEQLLGKDDKSRIILLTTNMCPKHRLELIYEIKDRLNRREKLICISTSLIEAGVDISFHQVIRSLAGLDSIAQAAGRCNRNGELELGIVKVIRSKDEDLSRLPEIKSAQNATNPILRKFLCEVDGISDDLLSPEVLEKFYGFYYREMNSEMNYRMKDKNTNLLDLLSINETGVKAYYTNTSQYPKMILNQAFKTAGNEFEVIVNNSIAVLVPYNKEAIDLINILNGVSSITETKKALKKVQAYTVNLFQADFDKLYSMRVIKPLLHYGIYALAEGFYSIDTGITSETNMDFLSI